MCYRHIKPIQHFVHYHDYPWDTNPPKIKYIFTSATISSSLQCLFRSLQKRRFVYSICFLHKLVKLCRLTFTLFIHVSYSDSPSHFSSLKPELKHICLHLRRILLALQFNLSWSRRQNKDVFTGLPSGIEVLLYHVMIPVQVIHHGF